MRRLNLGCGERIHADWENVDMYPYAPGVRVLDLTRRLPYEDGTFDVVYHSHVLEHFPQKHAYAFVRECYRILKRGGVIRIAVPDLEGIARLYLESLEKASAGALGWADKYDWMVMEMYDQCVREESCGALLEYFGRGQIPNEDFILQRWGTFARPLIARIRKESAGKRGSNSEPKRAWDYILRRPGEVVRDKFLRMLMSAEDREALRVGRFRRAGEVHMWMYDRYSLARLLQQTGFVDERSVGPTESRIAGWEVFHLETDADGQVYKADSMYIEASKA